MTTTSAGNGPSAGDGGRGDGGRDGGDWGWFTPPAPQSDQETDEEQAYPGEEAGEHRQAPRRQGGAIRPVGSSASRTRQAEAPTQANRPERPQQPRQGAGTGHEAAREHPAPSPHFAGQPQGQAPNQAQNQGRYQGPSQAAQSQSHYPSQHQSQNRQQNTARPAAEAQRPPHGPLFDESVAADVPSSTDGESRDGMLIRRTMEEVEPYADAATAYFYALLFVQHPQLRELFPASMDTQRDRLFRALLTAVRLADDPDVLTRYLSGLGRGHRKYGTAPEHYPAVGECLLGALSQYAPESWNDETEEAWVRAYTLISQTMIDAAAEDEQHSPPWWNAQIVSHELRTPQIAVITLRPDQPYPFLAGQYTSVETPWWPRVWRHYSFASSPRSDGLLTFHVKAVPTGWVSSALVNRARPGDVVRLGPPAGSMTVDHATDSGLLCVGGGTGIAPIKALVEDVAQHGRRRPMEVFYGARSDHDLYDLETMLRLEQQHGWLAVRPVVADGPAPASPNAFAGQLPDAVRRYGPWSRYDGYLSGPPGMIRNGVDALVDSGVPAHRIRHDAVAELMASGD
ncbi:globin domain-containing protein [Streptomyces albidus (ex Kaewkla and Franco 2022)]|uniref:globin domain-containing protein n=1 Tax=Streptomyces albidus (ex Kaewkla and Franco 2022) TaxID=722709 RepID=UPI0015EF3509|nr:globin domain-containing protein [Streptomyces albidus (ex Kaewkla and Franco 2022)]